MINSYFDDYEFIYDCYESSDDELLINNIHENNDNDEAKESSYAVEVALLSDIDFKTHFILSKSCVEEIVIALGPLCNNYPGCEVGIQTFVLAGLWALGNHYDYSEICIRFEVSEDWARKSLHSFYSLIILAFSEKVKWPKILESERVVYDFEKATGIPHVIGVLGSCYVNIGAASNYEEFFENKMIGVYATCNRHHCFTSLFIDVNGVSNKILALCESDLWKELEDTSFSSKYSGAVLLADDSFPLTEHIITPFSFTNMTNDHLYFNLRLSQTCIIIDETFYLWKSKFKRLDYLNLWHPDYASNVIRASVVLHNMNIMNGNYVPDDIGDIICEARPVLTDRVQQEANEAGWLKRNELLDKLIHLKSTKHLL